MSPDDPTHDAPDPGGDTDDVASALIDGLFDDADAAVAWRRPEVRARVSQLAAARERVRDVPPPPGSAARERALAAALAAFDEGADAEAGPEPTPGAGPAAVPHEVAGGEPSPASLADHRARRARRQGPPRWLGAAAAVAILAAVGAAIATVGSRSDEDMATDTAAQDESPANEGGASAEADEGGESGTDDAASNPPAAEEGEATGAARAPADLGDLGTFASAAALVDSVRDVDAARLDAGAGDDEAHLDVEAQRTVEQGLTAGGIACEPLPDALSAPGTVVRSSGTASLDGDVVSALVVIDPTGGADSARVVVVDGACDVRADEPL